MGTSEEMLYIIRTADEASKPAQAIRAEFDKISQAVLGINGPLGGVKTKFDELAKSKFDSLKSALAGIRSEEQKTDEQTKTLGDHFDTFFKRVKAGAEWALGKDLYHALRDGLNDLVHVIPDAFSAGYQFVSMLRDLQLQTGLSAESTSTLAGVFRRLGIDTSTLPRVLQAFGKNLAQNEGLLNSMGIATQGLGHKQLDALTILENTRKAFNAYGPSLIASGKASELFGRTTYDLIRYLQAGDAEINRYKQDLKDWGLVLDQATLNKADQFRSQLTNLGDGIAALQEHIFAALEPTVESFVNGFKTFIQAHFTQIVTFVVSAANFVMGVVGGLLGIDFTPIQLAAEKGGEALKTFKQWAAMQQQLPGATATATSAIDAQTAAIDRQIAAIRARSQASQQAAQRAQLMLSVEKALQQLDDLKGNKPYLIGLSNSEQQLAIQKHAQDLADAQKAVGDAKKSLSSFDLSSSEQSEIAALEAKKARLQAGAAAAKKEADLEAGYADYVRTHKAGNDSKTLASTKAMFDAVNAATQEWRDKGVAFAADLKGAFNGLMEVLVGSDHFAGIDAKGAVLMTHSGGLVGALGGLGGMMDKIKTALEIGAAFLVAKLAISLGGALIDAGTGILGLAGLLGVGGPLLLAIAAVAAALFALHKLDPNPVKGIPGLDPSAPWFWPEQPNTPGFPGLDFLPPRASGGPVTAGTLYQVNENGREYFRPSVDGTVIPIGGAGGRDSGERSVTHEIHTHVYLDGRKIAEAVDERLYVKAANSPVGSRAFKGASSG
jgi:hypothetical protein